MVFATSLQTNDRTTFLASLSGAIAGGEQDFRDCIHPLPEGNYSGERSRWLASIVDSSDDAILSCALDGVVVSWNSGAQRLFGYAAEEMIGGLESILIPPELENGEARIFERIQRGERIDHYETVRRHKDGSFIDLSLTVSPLRASTGLVIGISKVARDSSKQLQARDQQKFLLEEMDHRIKNLFALANSVVGLSARRGGSSGELVANVRSRLCALARAHSLALFASPGVAPTEGFAKLHALIETITAPYAYRLTGERERVTVDGSDIPISPGSLPSLALLFHELTTNAAIYGALSVPEGRVDIRCEVAGDMFVLRWTELGGPPLRVHPNAEGFGSQLMRMAVEERFEGTISRDWLPEGLAICFALARERLAN